MNFENQYLKYDEYRFLGGKCNIMPFNLLEYEARKILDTRTQNRLLNVEEIPQEVKMCINAMINSIETYLVDNNVNKNVASESTDGYSVSYVTSSQIQEVVKSKSVELENIMFNYLASTGLIYLGVI